MRCMRRPSLRIIFVVVLLAGSVLLIPVMANSEGVAGLPINAFVLAAIPAAMNAAGGACLTFKTIRPGHVAVAAVIGAIIAVLAVAPLLARPVRRSQCHNTVSESWL